MPHPPAGATDRVHSAARWEGAGVRQRPSSQVPHRRVRFGCGGSCVSFNGPRSAPRPTSLKAAVLFEVAKRKAGFPETDDKDDVPDTFTRPCLAQMPLFP